MQRKIRKYDVERTLWKGVGVPSALCGLEVVEYRR